MMLEEWLATIREQSRTRMPPETRAVLLRSIDDLRTSGIMQRVARVGSPAPEFTLPNAAGHPVSLGISDPIAQKVFPRAGHTSGHRFEGDPIALALER
jgi:hypothetical protein